MAFWLAYPGERQLGEGLTPVVDLPVLAQRNKVRRLLVKCEGANPTGSHKDRMSAGLIRRARDVGATTVAVASSGNAGASMAAYAANAGIDCVVVTTETMGRRWQRSIALSGARIVIAPDVAARWELINQRVEAGEWYPATNFTMPAVGSNPFAVDGLRSIAFELYLSLGCEQPTDIVVPVSRADLLWGLVKGYADLVASGRLQTMPRIHAAEPFPRLSRVLEGEYYTGSFKGTSRLQSLGGDTVTYQAIAALAMSGGSVVAPTETETMAAQREFAMAGLFVESASAIVLSGLAGLRRSSVISEEASILLIATSHGYKEDD
ncbi:threonine synthase [Rhizobium panacihumi]|uniref:threonine synthase n=1 Tax=Rhizobium panacihumi TaxID=2008450 RepID=UPI003D7BCACD